MTTHNPADRRAQLASFTIGQRVQTHPATDRWMMGDRYGNVVKIGRKYVRVSLDRSGRSIDFPPSQLMDAECGAYR